MKKSLLLITIGLMAGIAKGQEARHTDIAKGQNAPILQLMQNSDALLQNQSLIFIDNEQANNTTAAPNNQTPAKAARTTSPLSRWYDYSGEYFPGILDAEVVANHDVLNYLSVGLWNDTTGVWGYTGVGTGGLTGPYTFNGETTFSGNIGIAQGLDPSYTLWNDTAFGVVMAVTPADVVSVDSVLIPGAYTRSSIVTAAKLAVVDTLIVTLVAGTQMTPDAITSGPVLTGYGVASINFLDLGHDVANNRGGAISGTTVSPVPLATQVMKILLHATDTNNLFYKSPLYKWAPQTPGAFSVPAGSTVAMSVTFKSGDTSYHARGGNPGDTIRYSDGTNITGTKYNYWDALDYYVAGSTTSTTPLWNLYDPANRSTSYFAIAGPGWGAPAATYTPNWDIITGTTTAPTPASFQTTGLGFHLTCTTCSLTGSGPLGVKAVTFANSVNAYPNPASDVLNITYSSTAPVSVTLTNMVGQVVATQNATNGNAVFNTAELPSGVYIYALQANGERTTGRVAVSH